MCDYVVFRYVVSCGYLSLPDIFQLMLQAPDPPVRSAPEPGLGAENVRPGNETSGNCYAQIHTEQRSNARQRLKIKAIN